MSAGAEDVERKIPPLERVIDQMTAELEEWKKKADDIRKEFEDMEVEMLSDDDDDLVPKKQPAAPAAKEKDEEDQDKELEDDDRARNEDQYDDDEEDDDWYEYTNIVRYARHVKSMFVQFCSKKGFFHFLAVFDFIAKTVQILNLGSKF